MSFIKVVPQRRSQRQGRQYFRDDEDMSLSKRAQFIKIVDDSEDNDVNDSDDLLIELDLSEFRPQDIEVKANDDVVVVHAEHEERDDKYGSVEREFTRKYVLPEDVDADDLIVTVDKNGVLKIETNDDDDNDQKQWNNTKGSKQQQRRRQQQRKGIYQKRQLMEQILDVDDNELEQLPLYIQQQSGKKNENSEQIEFINTEDKMAIKLNLNFKPEDIDVKIKKNTLIIYAEQKEMMDKYGSVEKELTRKYELPEDVEPQDVKTSITENGTLMVDIMKSQTQMKQWKKQSNYQWEDEDMKYQKKGRQYKNRNSRSQSLPLRLVEQY